MITPLLTSLVCATICGLAIWYADHRLVGHGQRIRRIASAVLIAISTATITLILFANLLLGDGDIKPMPYHQALVVFRMRVVAMLLMILGILIAVTVLSSMAQLILSPQSGAKWQHFIMPVIAAAMYILAFWLVGEYRFFPVA